MRTQEERVSVKSQVGRALRAEDGEGGPHLVVARIALLGLGARKVAQAVILALAVVAVVVAVEGCVVGERG